VSILVKYREAYNATDLFIDRRHLEIQAYWGIDWRAKLGSIAPLWSRTVYQRMAAIAKVMELEMGKELIKGIVNNQVSLCFQVAPQHQFF